MATTQTAEAGAAAKRELGAGGEIVLRSAAPIFRCEGPGATNVRVYALNSPMPHLVWSGASDKPWLEHPENAPKLQPLVRYRAEVTHGEAKASVMFSVDPELLLGDSKMNRTIAVKTASR